ncbi:MAG: hypothetical protein IIT56_09195 [Bacteroidales bacterium]|nr:hypothetical protein [Bacteroidales bacterium]
MKKQLTILSLSALTLFSCGGNKSQNQSVAEKNDSAKTVTTEPSNNTVEAAEKTAEVSENLDSVLQKINPWLKKLPENPDRKFYFFEHEVDTIKGLAYFKDFLYAYPFKTGGYLTVSEHSEMSEENYIPMTQRETYIYKDGKLSSAKNVLPVPDPVMFTNAEKRTAHKADFDAMSALYKRRSSDYVNYIFYNDKPEIRTVLRLINYDDSDWKKEYSDLLEGNDKPSYRWDGEKFVFFDPFEEFMKSLPESPDKAVYQNNKVEYIMDEFCSVSEDCYAFPITGGGYLGVFSYNCQCEASMSWYDSTYVYKDGKIKSVSNVLPVPEISALLDEEKCKGNDGLVREIVEQYNKYPKDYLLYYISDDGTLSVSAEGNGCEQWGENQLELMKNAVYKWDGEKFIKQ